MFIFLGVIARRDLPDEAIFLNVGGDIVPVGTYGVPVTAVPVGRGGAGVRVTAGEGEIVGDKVGTRVGESPCKMN